MHLPLFFMRVLMAATASAQAQQEPIVGKPCEGCEAVFDGKPAQLESRTRIAPASEPGTPMIVTGKVLDARGNPRSGIVVYAYQTNQAGIYPPSPSVKDPQTRRHGRLRAWVESDAAGNYTFDTIRPGSYPNNDIPEHIHVHVIEPGCATYYIDDILFTDDPKLTPEKIRQLAANRAGNGIATPTRKDGTWHVTRDIHLGKNIPGHPGCASTPAAQD